ncbi:MAG: Sugar isomerase (SIS) [Candidatus Woesebacteria bacterium GW2011_GWC1_43_10b]|uniref:Sugar isomerase (SIS) n=1 Tax=Candidatus Woesebacteria bacterium GW2011_GWC1_43_10b TaxID=1618585 RepID=A0A0G1F240_9BACT|nr:MAG: Sugar isomerase (SIS) [Candidatus Woesebacteria bacterium GW2011_GWC1_43_10b]
MIIFNYPAMNDIVPDLIGIVKAIKKADFVYIIGNGGSASTANHFANDLVKMCGIKAMSLCANEAVVMAYANDNGYENVFSDQLKVFLTKNDLLITISGSGTSKNIVKAVQVAKKIGAGVYTFPTMRDYKCSMLEIENKHLRLAHDIVKKL